MTEELTGLKRKVERLEHSLEEARAERDLYEMMMHDLSSDAIVGFIEKRYPALAKMWAKG